MHNNQEVLRGQRAREFAGKAGKGELEVPTSCYVLPAPQIAEAVRRDHAAGTFAEKVVRAKEEFKVKFLNMAAKLHTSKLRSDVMIAER